MDNADLPVAVLLEEYEPETADGGIRHHMECVPLLERLQVLKFGQILYHVVELLLVMLRPVELDSLVGKASKFICCHCVVRAEHPKVCYKL